MDAAKPINAPISRATLHEEIVGRLQDMIFNGDLVEDSRVPERQLCAQFGISRTPLREALKVLANEGLITLLPNRGARVTRLTPDQVEELFPVIGALEALSGELACRHISNQGIAEVRALHYQMALHHARGDRAAYFRLNQEIHKKIMEYAANPALLQAYQSLAGRIRRARYMANDTRERWDEAVVEHEQMLDALERRDGKSLATLLRDHLLNKLDAVKVALGAAEEAR
jgi:DNA-binding GntR family transcriptional regulator